MSIIKTRIKLTRAKINIPLIRLESHFQQMLPTVYKYNEIKLTGDFDVCWLTSNLSKSCPGYAIASKAIFSEKLFDLIPSDVAVHFYDANPSLRIDEIQLTRTGHAYSITLEVHLKI